MEEENKVVEETITETVMEAPKKRTRRPVDPADLRKTCAALKKENEELKIQIDQMNKFVESANAQKQQLEAMINGLQIKYTRITEYVKRSLGVFHQSVLMAFEEEVK